MSAPVDRLFRPQLAGLHGYVPQPSRPGHRLHLNESPEDLPSEVKAAIAARVASLDFSRYPESTQALLDALAALDAWTPDGIHTGNGSNELLQVLLYATLVPGDAIVLAAPSFSVYATQARVAGARIVEVPLRAGSPDPFRFDVDALVRAANASRAKLILLGSPNNPTGTELSDAEIRRLHDETEGLVAIDEAYRHFADRDAVPLLATCPRLLLLRTFSKSFAAAALRLGYALGAPALIERIRTVAMPYNTSAVTTAIALELLERPMLLQSRVARVVAERERGYESISNVYPLVPHPGRANFVVFEHPSKRASELANALAARGVLVRDLGGYDGLGHCIRAGVGTPEANDALLAALREVV